MKLKLINNTKQKVYVNGDILLRERSYPDCSKIFTISITSDVGNGVIKVKNGVISSMKSYANLKITESSNDSQEKLIILSV